MTFVQRRRLFRRLSGICPVRYLFDACSIVVRFLFGGVLPLPIVLKIGWRYCVSDWYGSNRRFSITPLGDIQRDARGEEQTWSYGTAMWIFGIASASATWLLDGTSFFSIKLDGLSQLLQVTEISKRNISNTAILICSAIQAPVREGV